MTSTIFRLEKLYCLSRTLGTVILFPKLNTTFLGYFDPTNNVLCNIKNNYHGEPTDVQAKTKLLMLGAVLPF